MYPPDAWDSRDTGGPGGMCASCTPVSEGAEEGAEVDEDVSEAAERRGRRTGCAPHRLVRGGMC